MSNVLLSTQQHTQLKFELIEELKRLGVQVKIGRDYDPQCGLRANGQIVVFLNTTFDLTTLTHECVHAIQRLTHNGKLQALGGYNTARGEAEFWSIYEYLLQVGDVIGEQQYTRDREAEIEAFSLMYQPGRVLQLLRSL